MLEAFVCDLYWMARRGGWRWSGYSTSRPRRAVAKTRYDTPLSDRRRVSAVAAFLRSSRFIEVAPGYMKPDNRTGGLTLEGVSSKARATAKLIAFLEGDYAASVDDIGDRAFESIILRAPKAARWSDRKAGEALDYADTDETYRWRDEMERVNAAVAAAQVSLVGHAVDLRSAGRLGQRGYRVFNDGTFHRGGRLYGWWWQSLPKGERQRLRVRGEPVVEVDFQAMHLRLLYSRRGIDFPPEIDPFDPTWLALEGTPRANIKEEFLRAVNRSGPAIRPSTQQRRILDALRRAHRPIAHDLYTGAGIELMRTDSDIAVAVVLALAERNIPGPADARWLPCSGARCGDGVRGDEGLPQHHQRRIPAKDWHQE